MTLCKGIGVRFSELRDNHEDAPYWVWNRQDVRTYVRFGVLPNGEGFGVAKTPTQENSYARDTVIVGEDGEILATGWGFPDGGIGDHYPEPEVMVASPSAKTIVWLGGGELWVWYQDDELQRFISGFTKRIRIPNDAAVLVGFPSWIPVPAGCPPRWGGHPAGTGIQEGNPTGTGIREGNPSG